MCPSTNCIFLHKLPVSIRIIYMVLINGTNILFNIELIYG